MEMNIINPGEIRNPAPLQQDHVNDFEMEHSTSPSIYLSQTIHQYNTFNDDTQEEPSSTGDPPYVLMEEEGQYNICPACRRGVLLNQYPCYGILLAVFLFPCGIFCCYLSREKICSDCKSVFS
ncbi:UNVERIFIED_CONTAM: hypothetical protein RMT77_005931 [Armadillidium vulgare]